MAYLEEIRRAAAGERRHDNVWDEPDLLIRAITLLRKNAAHASSCNTKLREPCSCWLHVVDEWIERSE